MVFDSTSPVNGSAAARFARLAGVLAALALGAQALYFFWYSYRAIVFPYPLDYGEGPILQLARELAAGRALYPPVAEPPYLIASYEPAYQLICALGVRLFGVQFWFGRLVSVLSVVAIAAVVARIVYAESRDRLAAFIAGSAIFAMPHFVVWGSFMRVDAFALALATVGLWLFQRGARVGGGALFALAVFTRRTSVAAMGAAYLEYAVTRGWPRGIALGLVQAAVIVALLAGANAWSGGGMYEHLMLHTSTSLGKAWWSLANVWWLLWSRENPSPLSLWPLWFALSVGAAGWALVTRRARLLVVWFALAAGVFLTGGRIGAAHNYFMEPTAVGMMLFGLLYAELAAGGERARLLAGALALAVVAQLAWTVVRFTPTYEILQLRVDAGSSARVVELIRAADGPVLVEDTGLTLVAGREPPLMPFEFTMLARAGAIDPGPVYAAAREGRYALIVTRFDPFDPEAQRRAQLNGYWHGGRWPEGIIAPLRARYRLVERAGPYYVFAP